MKLKLRHEKVRRLPLSLFCGQEVFVSEKVVDNEMNFSFYLNNFFIAPLVWIEKNAGTLQILLASFSELAHQRAQTVAHSPFTL